MSYLHLDKDYSFSLTPSISKLLYTGSRYKVHISTIDSDDPLEFAFTTEQYHAITGRMAELCLLVGETTGDS